MPTASPFIGNCRRPKFPGSLSRETPIPPMWRVPAKATGLSEIAGNSKLTTTSLATAFIVTCHGIGLDYARKKYAGQPSWRILDRPCAQGNRGDERAQHNRSVLPEFSDGDVANTPATSRCAGVDGDKPGRKPRLCASISKQHRAKSDCSVCHDMIDPIGFCMENCDASGTWSDRDGKFLIEPAGPRGGMIKRDRGFRRKPHNTAAWCILTRKPGD